MKKTTKEQEAAKPSHTPGPFTVVRQNDMAGTTRQIIMAGPQAVAYVYGTGAENDANAALLASAPDLLAALKKIEHYACSKMDPMTLDDIKRTAYAAILRAEGK